MVRETMNLSIPTIDFSIPDMTPGRAEWDSVKDRVRQALEEYGCFEASFDKVSRELGESILDAAEEICGLPLETKKKNTFDRSNCGYYNGSALHHSLCVEDSSTPGSVEVFTKTLWPEGNPSISESILSFSQKLSELDQMVRRMILESLGLTQCIDEHLQSTIYNFRINVYEAPNSEDKKLGMGPHYDKGFLTILFQNQVEGFQVLTKDGQWKNVNFSPNTFIVLMGDSLHALTNGRLNSAYHRVMISGNQTRYSVGSFSVPKPGYLIKAAEELVDEEHPLQYKPFDYYGYIKFAYGLLLANEPIRSPLKAFCGV